MDYSILMSVYYKEKPEYLKEAIESMLNQTVKSNDFVIVCDGPLTKELYEVIDFYEKENNCNAYGDLFIVNAIFNIYFCIRYRYSSI